MFCFACCFPNIATFLNEAPMLKVDSLLEQYFLGGKLAYANF